MSGDITHVKRSLADRALDVCGHLLPRGRLENGEWCCGDISGAPGRSLKVHVRGPKAGVWADFAEGKGGDLLDLWREVKGCSLREALDEARRWLGISLPKFERREKSYRRPDKPRCSAPKFAVLDYLVNERHLSRNAIESYRVGERDRTIVFLSLLPEGELVLVKYLNIDRCEGGKKAVRVETGCEPALFGWQAIDADAREVTITEGEIDAMSAFDYGYSALSVPFGGGRGSKQSWIESEFDRLAQFERIYLALDMDAEGDAAVEEIATRLGRHRCVRVRLPHKDLNDCLMKGLSREEIRSCFDEAESLDPPELERAGAFADEVVNLFWPAGKAAQGHRLGFTKIGDKLMFRPGELTLWTGVTGDGKSQILSCAFIDWATQGARVCVASLEMAPRQLLRRMVKQAAGEDRPSTNTIREVMGWFDNWLWLYAHVGKSSTQRVLEVFEYARSRYGCDVFVIDSLMRLGISPDDYAAQEKAAFEITNWAVTRSVHVHLVAHARKPAVGANVPEIHDVKGTTEIASNAFNVIGVWRNRRLEEEIERASRDGDNKELEALLTTPGVILNVAKQRNGDWEGKTGLWFSRETYQYRDEAHASPRRSHEFIEEVFDL